MGEEARPAEAPDRRTAVLGWLLIALLALGSVEAASFMFLRVSERRNPLVFAFDPDEYLRSLPEKLLENYERAAELHQIYAPDARVGWTRVAGSKHTFPDGTTIDTDALGARQIPGASGAALLSTYGDSFTEGLEVDDADTWEAGLARQTGAMVWNFGVSGYGPDQALLALERNLERGVRTPIVILALVNENLNRIMTAFRPFYTYPYPDILVGFKPLFVKEADGFAVRSYQPSDIQDRSALRRAIVEASRGDPFLERRTERVAFPFSAHAAGFLWRQGLHPAAPWLGASEVARERMAYILRRFVGDARRFHFVPVLALLPEGRDSLQQTAGQSHGILAPLAAQLPELTFVDIPKLLSGPDSGEYVAGFRPDRFIKVVHPSAYGNEAIAAVLSRSLERQIEAAQALVGAPESSDR